MNKSISKALTTCLLACVLISLNSCQSNSNSHGNRSSYNKAYPNNKVMSKGKYSARQMARYFNANNKRYAYNHIHRFAEIYIEESAIEGVNHDLAFAQMCHETNFLRFGNQVKNKQNNFCGLGATDDGAQGATFATVRLGVRAQIQHLKAYGNSSRLRKPQIDPRFHLVRRSSAPTIEQLTGRWATDPNYHQKLYKHLGKISRF